MASLCFSTYNCFLTTLLTKQSPTRACILTRRSLLLSMTALSTIRTVRNARPAPVRLSIISVQCVLAKACYDVSLSIHIQHCLCLCMCLSARVPTCLPSCMLSVYVCMCVWLSACLPPLSLLSLSLPRQLSSPDSPRSLAIPLRNTRAYTRASTTATP